MVESAFTGTSQRPKVGKYVPVNFNKLVVFGIQSDITGNSLKMIVYLRAMRKSKVYDQRSRSKYEIL
jgi:hypothetical protein